MRLFIFLLTTTLIPISVFADDLDNQINKACLRHAVSLVAKLKTEVIGKLNQEKSDQALKLVTDSCQAYFKKEFSQNSDAVAAASNNKTEEDDRVTDWLTKKILGGDTSRKEGNNRIKKIK